MTRMRLLGFAALAGCGSLVVAAVALGLWAGMRDLPLGGVAALITALAVAAEVLFWIGGGLLGLSIIAKRKAAFARLARRLGLLRT